MKIGEKDYVCTLDYAMDLIRGKWKAVIICHLNDRACRFLKLQRRLPGVSQKILSEKLAELVDDQLVTKNVISHTPPNVEYELTEQGLKLYKILRELQDWSDLYIEKRYKVIPHQI